MPIYTVAGPDGKTYDIEGPAGATADQLGSVITSQNQGQHQANAESTRSQMAKEYAPAGFGQALKEQVGNLAAGAVRGAGSIGATITDQLRGKLADPVNQAVPANMRPDVTAGLQDAPRGDELRTSMTDVLRTAGADPSSPAFTAGKLGTEVAGTMGVGGAAAQGLTKFAPGVAKAVPALVDALRTGGFTAGGATGPTAAAVRSIGGAVNGGLSAGLIDPKDMAAGAAVGAAAPLVVKGMGAIGEKIGDSANDRLADALKKYSAGAPKRETIEAAIDAGYVIPPNMVNPSFANQTIESIAGKQATQQIASTKNTEVTEGLVRKALGIPEDVPLSKSTLEGLRKTAGTAYADVSSLSPQAATDLEALKVARNEAQGWFRAYNRSASPLDLAKAKDARALSDSLEQTLEQHAASANRPELIPALRDARKEIAKTYTVERSLNDASGTVDARVLGRMLEKGVPLTDELKTAGRFASAFPTVAKSPQQVGSPAAHNMKALASALMGGGGIAAAGPLGVGAAAVPFVAPPLARALMFRQGAQQALVQGAPQASNAAQLAIALRDPAVQQLILKSAPALAAAGGP